VLNKAEAIEFSRVVSLWTNKIKLRDLEYFETEHILKSLREKRERCQLIINKKEYYAKGGYDADILNWESSNKCECIVNNKIKKRRT